MHKEKKHKKIKVELAHSAVSNKVSDEIRNKSNFTKSFLVTSQALPPQTLLYSQALPHSQALL